MNTSEIPLSIAAMRIDDREAAELLSKFSSRVEGVPVVAPSADTFTDPRDIPMSVTCRCEQYNLQKEEDRRAYGDLISRTRETDPAVFVLWEERISSPDGGLYIYITIADYARVV